MVAAFCEADANLVAADVEEMGRLAGSDFPRHHPDVGERAVEALA